MSLWALIGAVVGIDWSLNMPSGENVLLVWSSVAMVQSQNHAKKVEEESN